MAGRNGESRSIIISSGGKEDEKEICGTCIGAAACLTLGMLTACGTDEEPPAPQEGTLYQTGVETFWAGIGKAYISFEYLETPETPEEGELYGNVFRVNVDAGDGYSAWLTGSWTLDEASDGTFGDLTLTATWDESAENPTTLADAQSGVAKTYSLTDGVYTIGVGIPSAGTVRTGDGKSGRGLSCLGAQGARARGVLLCGLADQGGDHTGGHRQRGFQVSLAVRGEAEHDGHCKVRVDDGGGAGRARDRERGHAARLCRRGRHGDAVCALGAGEGSRHGGGVLRHCGRSVRRIQADGRHRAHG